MLNRKGIFSLVVAIILIFSILLFLKQNLFFLQRQNKLYSKFLINNNIDATRTIWENNIDFVIYQVIISSFNNKEFDSTLISNKIINLLNEIYDLNIKPNDVNFYFNLKHKQKKNMILFHFVFNKDFIIDKNISDINYQLKISSEYNYENLWKEK